MNKLNEHVAFALYIMYMQRPNEKCVYKSEMPKIWRISIILMSEQEPAPDIFL